MDGIVTAKPKHKEYVFTQKRLDSFKLWSSNVPIEPVTMVDSGLFYSGNGDYVTCFYCGTGFSDWESDDVPNIEHIKFYPDCPFMNLMFDRQYIDKISNVASSKQKETSDKFEDPMTHSTVLSCIQSIQISITHIS